MPNIETLIGFVRQSASPIVQLFWAIQRRVALPQALNTLIWSVQFTRH